MGAGGRWGGMPDLNYDEPVVRETHAYLKELAAAVRKAKPQAVMVGENAADREDQIAPTSGKSKLMGNSSPPAYPRAPAGCGG